MISTLTQLACQIDQKSWLFIGLTAVYCVWRWWRFTIEPALHPERPKPLPYLVPFLGNAISFLSEGNETISRGRKYFNNSPEPFALTIFGGTVYIISNAKDISTVWRRSTDLTFDAYVKALMVSIGLSPDGVHKMLHFQPSSSSPREKTTIAFPNPNKKPAMGLSRGMFEHQLHPGQRFDKLQSALLGRIDGMMTWSFLSTSKKAILAASEDKESRTVSLVAWIQYILMDSSTRAFFGNSLLDDIDPELLDHFSCFDDRSWQLIFSIPRPWSGKMLAALARVQGSLSRYFELPKERRSDASWLIQAMEAEMVAAGINTTDVAANVFLIYWGINANAWKVAFWLLTHLIFDPSLLISTRSEISQAAVHSPTPSAFYANLEACPHLMAAYHETLRLTVGSIGTRDVTTPTHIGGKQLQPGARIIIPFRSMLTDTSAFGPDSTTFDSARFLNNPELAYSPYYKPFGGGDTYCPGRFLAKAEVVTVVALAVLRFDLRRKHEGMGFPEREGNVPFLGTMKPARGQDVVLRVEKAEG
ncbi:cytochrome P450 [Saccharata proteae CBS 121410]|uniref:Cytochrome P450 n=1 Tax=Saccharata proteae CBS 121410 TaxID=1314787 RepID=A0A9P4HXU4_9PEZI|nr:cytochrome P450 [Saccharata proteae CBS 121410]